MQPVIVRAAAVPFVLAERPCLGCAFKQARHDVKCPKRIRELQLLERTPSAVALATARTRDTFADLCDSWDLLPDAR